MKRLSACTKKEMDVYIVWARVWKMWTEVFGNFCERNKLHRFELKSLILAQIERWRHALHMQVERERGQP